MGSVDYEISLMAKSPFVKAMTLAVIKNFLSHRFSYDTREVINSELVPRFSERVTMASMKPGMIEHPQPSVMHEIARPVPFVRQEVFSKPSLPRAVPGRQIQQTPLPRRVQQRPQMTLPINHGEFKPVEGDYGKITALLNDPSVSSIECPGPSKQVMVIRAGQRQITNIILSQEEIKNILEEIADRAMVPLIDGVFRAAVDNFVINAVISEMIGTRFVIKKSTPYALLER